MTLLFRSCDRIAEAHPSAMSDFKRCLAGVDTIVVVFLRGFGHVFDDLVIEFYGTTYCAGYHLD
jgi:hypothetical protein